MSSVPVLPKVSLKGRVSEEEWKKRVDLAACYRLTVLEGWEDTIYLHHSLRVDHDSFLINPFGLLFDEVTASNLIKVNFKGDVLDDTPFTPSPSALATHTAILEARPDVHCIMHVHTKEAMAVSCLESGLLPLSQSSLFPCLSMSYHAYGGLAAVDEKDLVQGDLGAAHYMLLRNHGALTVGETAGQAFMRIYDLQRACEVQLLCLAAGQKLTEIAPDIVQRIGEDSRVVHGEPLPTGETKDEIPAGGGDIAWPALLRRVHTHDPGFAE